MISEFSVYLRLGFEHITDIQGYDHLLFVGALTAAYGYSEWRRLLWLVTAFTVGHSLTLGLATLDLVRVSSGLVEFLIPLTILITSIMNIAVAARADIGGEKSEQAKDWVGRGRYGAASVFGLIHGMGFSNFLRAALGGEEGVVFPLFAFNVGLELGQLVIVLAVLGVGSLVTRLVHGRRGIWTITLSGVTALVSIALMIDRLVGST